MDLRNCYAFTRIVFLRYLAFIYAVAFLVAYTQNEGLIGSDGLTPAKPWMDMVYTRSCGSDRWRCFTSIPTLFWYMVELPGDVKDPDAAAASAAAAAAAREVGKHTGGAPVFSVCRPCLIRKKRGRSPRLFTF